jgi:hypothetical protein
MEKIGIDVHKVATQVCVMTEDGEFKEFRIRAARFESAWNEPIVTPNCLRVFR